jgi:hypothetical protein
MKKRKLGDRLKRYAWNRMQQYKYGRPNPSTAAEWLHFLGLGKDEAVRYAKYLGKWWKTDLPYNHLQAWIHVYVDGLADPVPLPPGHENMDENGCFIWRRGGGGGDDAEMKDVKPQAAVAAAAAANPKDQ